MRRRAVEGVREGDTFTAVRAFTEEDILRFGEVSGDANPVHYEDRFAQARGFSGRICHGLLVGSLLTEIGGRLGWLAARMDFRFKRPVYPGDTVRCKLTITDLDERGKAEARADFRNQDGRTVLEAFLTGLLPDRQQEEVMKTVMEEGIRPPVSSNRNRSTKPDAEDIPPDGETGPGIQGKARSPTICAIFLKQRATRFPSTG